MLSKRKDRITDGNINVKSGSWKRCNGPELTQAFPIEMWVRPGYL